MILGLKSVDCCVNVTLKVLRIVSNEGGWAIGDPHLE